jgi:hypothetical protein
LNILFNHAIPKADSNRLSYTHKSGCRAPQARLLCQLKADNVSTES